MIKKKRSANGKSVRVTFQLPSDAATEKVAIVGDFNDWNEEEDTMKLDSKSGVWKRSISLKPGKEYQFRYLVDGVSWCNDEDADGFAPNPYYSENCVLTV